MGTKYLVPGAILSVTGIGLFLLDAGFALSGPRLPESALGYVGWILLLVGLGVLKVGAAR